MVTGLTTLGIFKGLIGLITFHESALPYFGRTGPVSYPPDRFQHTIFKFYAGLDHGDLHEASGDLPDAILFDIHGKRIGSTFDPKPYLWTGLSETFSVETGGNQPAYTLFVANNNGICISFISATWPSFSNNFGWVGDWGSECSTDDKSFSNWYYGSVAVPGTNHFPNCLWIDRNGGHATAFQVNWLDMKPLPDDDRIGKKAHDMCQTPSFKIYQDQEPRKIAVHDRHEETQGDDTRAPKVDISEPPPSYKRSEPRRSVADAKIAFEQKYGNVLVIDDLSSHTAHALCASATSAGPSFVNPEEGYFCDMQTKETHPVCLPQNSTTVCFDMEQNQLVGPGLQKRSVPFEVRDWRHSKIY